MRRAALIAALVLMACNDPTRAQLPDEAAVAPSQPKAPAWMAEAKARAAAALAARWGEGEQPRIQRGVDQVAAFWRQDDGDAAAFEAFAQDNFAGDQAGRDALFTRFETILEKIDGHDQEISRIAHERSDLEQGPLLPVDELFSGYDPSAHISEDFFTNKLAFVVLLNFPLTTLEQRLREGPSWSRRQWAEARLAQRFGKRVPSDVDVAVSAAIARGENYINGYNIWVNHLVSGGKRPFTQPLRLLSHWNLRDEIRADYRDPQHGLEKQRMIEQVMDRIVTQTIPAKAIDNKDLDWDPSVPAPDGAREPDTRYARILDEFRAVRRADPYSPTAPTLIARRFDEERELPEARVRAMFEQVLSSPLVPRVAAVIQQRLGRPLEPFDIWYDGFSPRGAYPQEQLDQIVSARYPTAQAYQADIPNLLVKLGFTPDRARAIATGIVVEPARGSGHAMESAMRGTPRRLRTRVEPGGMNYKGFNIAVHEMGHNVEQTFSLDFIDHTLLAGVPNNAFTEALAFVFQARDLELLGLAPPAAQSRALATLNDFWGSYEIAGVALVDMGMWHWIYDHPDASPAELREAVLAIARDVWNRWYAPVFGHRDAVLLAVYSHMVNYPLYLPDYPLGHMIAFQIEEHMRQGKDLGGEFERMATIGSIAPDLWMQTATGAPVGPEALLRATDEALREL